MKFTFSISTLLLINILLWGCGGQQGQKNDEEAIRAQADTFLHAMANFQFEKARPLIDTSYTTTFESVESFSMNMVEKLGKGTIEEAFAHQLPATVTIQEVKVVSDSAFIHFTTQTPAFQNKGLLKMINREGTWRVCEQAAAL